MLNSYSLLHSSVLQTDGAISQDKSPTGVICWEGSATLFGH